MVTAGPVAELTRAPVRIFEIDASVAAPLPEVLRAAGALEVAPAPRGGFAVTLPAAVDTRAVFAAIAAAGGAVRRLVERRRSLAEVFLGAVRPAAASDADEVGP